MIIIMKLRPASFIAILLALFIANSTIAQAAMMLCRNKCEQPQVTQIDIPECCRGMKDTDHSSFQPTDHNMSPGDCPHVEGNKSTIDVLAFITPSTKGPAPDKAPGIAGISALSQARFANFRSLQRPVYPELPPSNITFPPPYRLFCSLLI